MNCFAKQSCDLAEYVIADGVTQCVIDLFESIEIHDEHRKRA